MMITMKKAILLICVFFLTSIALAEPSVSMDMPKETHIGAVNVVLNIHPDTASKIDIAEFVPKDWDITSWKVFPSVDTEFESSIHSFKGRQYNMNHWKFDNLKSDVSLTYEIYAKDKGNYNFVTLWLYPKGFKSFETELSVVNSHLHTSSNGNGVTGFAINPVDVALNKTIKTEEPKKNEEGVGAYFIPLEKIKDLVFNIPY